MKTATLNSNQFNISEAIFSDFESLDQSVFNNKSLSSKGINFNSKIVLISAFVLLIALVFGFYGIQRLFKDIYLNPIYHPINYGLYIVACGWVIFNGGISFYKLHLYLKFKPLESVTDIISPINTVFSYLLSRYELTGNRVTASIDNLLKPVFAIVNNQTSTLKAFASGFFSVYADQKHIMNFSYENFKFSFKHINNNVRIHEMFQQPLGRLEMYFITLSKTHNRNLDYST